MNIQKCICCGETIPTDKKCCPSCMNATEYLRQPLHVCPVCDKEFLPAPMHSYKIYVRKSNETGVVSGRHKLVCSYKCVCTYNKNEKFEDNRCKKEKEEK